MEHGKPIHYCQNLSPPMSKQSHTISQLDLDTWQELDYLLTDRKKPVLLVCTFDTIRGRDKTIMVFQEHFDQYKHVLLDTAGQEIVYLYKYLKEQLCDLPALSESKGIQHMVHLTDLDYSLLKEDIHQPGKLLPELNFERELIFREFPCILILWINRYTLNRLRHDAPDFWDWVQYQYHFPSPTDNVDRNPVEYDGPLESKGFTPERLDRVKELETRYKTLDQSGEDSERLLQDIATLLKLLGREYLEIFETDKAIDYFKRLLAVEEKREDEYGKGAAYFYLGDTYRITRNLELSLKYYHKSLNIDKAQENPANVARNHHRIGMIYGDFRRWEEALEHYQSSLQLKKEHELADELGATYHQIGRCYEEQREWEKALDNYQQAILWNQKAKQFHEIGGSYHQIGYLYYKQQIWEQSLENLKQAIDWKNKTHQFHQLHTSYALCGLVHQKQKDYKRARQYFHQGLAIAQRYDTGNISLIQSFLTALEEEE